MVTQVTSKIDKVRRIPASRTHQKTSVTAVTIVIYRILSCNHVRLNCNASNQARSLRALIRACRHYSPKKRWKILTYVLILMTWTAASGTWLTQQMPYPDKPSCEAMAEVVNAVKPTQTKMQKARCISRPAGSATPSEAD
jgi:hypothetical protein